MSPTDALSRHEELEKPSYCHEILIKGKDFERCKTRVTEFFERYQLVRYSAININRDRSVSATDSAFSGRLSDALQKNRLILRDMIKELRSEGVSTLDDIEKLPQGHKSKLLHIACHFLDGFMGIDTYFFNLEEDSHWVSDKLRRKIESEPSEHWLLLIEAEP